MSEQTAAPGWYADPYGRHEYRYWDGTAWTSHVASHGNQRVDPVPVAPHVPTVNAGAERIQRQVQQAGVAGAAPGAAAGASLLDQPVLVVNQEVKLIELNNEYAIFDQNGTQIGAVRQVGQTAVKKALRLVSSVDQFLTHKFQVCDMAGNVLLAVTRPAKLVKSTVVVADGLGREIGRVVQENMIGKIRFGMEAGGQRIGSLNAENWRAWNFNVQDANGVEVARITKTFEGLAKTLFTTADNYVLHVHRPLQDPLRSLVVASALTVDTALKQDDRGLG